MGRDVGRLADRLELDPELWSRLEGSFALVAWDGETQELSMSRDRLGTRPLFYTTCGGTTAFASEIGPLADLPFVENELDLDGVGAYFKHLLVPAPHTLLTSVRQVTPGMVERISSTQTRTLPGAPQEHWPALVADDPAALHGEFRSLLARSIESRLSDQRTGFLLSGGNDTAGLIGMARRVMGLEVDTFTLGFSDDLGSDESQAARKAARRLGTRHHEVTVDAFCIERLPALTRRLGIPIGNPASLIADSLFEQISEDVDVVLCGDGGNEVLGGVYKYNQMLTFVSGFEKKRGGRLVQRIGQDLWYRLRGGRLETLFQKLARLYFDHAGRQLVVHPDLTAEQIQEAFDFYVALESYWEDADLGRLVPGLKGDASTAIRNLLGMDSPIPVLHQVPIARTYSFIPYNVIPYVECNASANGIEPRFPYLDEKLVHFLLRLPFDQQYGRSHRHFMREALAPDVLDPSGFEQPMKGFSAPLDTWLQTPPWREVVYDHLESPTSSIRDLLDMDLVHEVLNTYYGGTRTRAMGNSGRAQPLGFSVWSLVAFEAWAREYLQ